jgi:hypothetical protein
MLLKPKITWTYLNLSQQNMFRLWKAKKEVTILSCKLGHLEIVGIKQPTDFLVGYECR